jgi:hypothetical protein
MMAMSFDGVRSPRGKEVDDMVKIKSSDSADAVDIGYETLVDMGDGCVTFRMPGDDDRPEGQDLKRTLFGYRVAYSAMEASIENLVDDRRAYRLFHAISGKGAFGKFREVLYAFDAEDEWYAFREGYCLEAARKWCEDKGIECERWPIGSRTSGSARLGKVDSSTIFCILERQSEVRRSMTS